MGFKDSLVTLGKRGMFTLKKNSPAIMTGGAILFGIGSLVATWVAARRHDKALEEPKEIIETAKSVPISETYTEKDRKHDIVLGYVKGAKEIVKLYGPAVLMGGFSIACILGSHKVLSRRNAGLVAANTILAKEFKDYRDNVIEKYGKEEDLRLKLADKMEKISETVTDENGEEKTVEREVPKKNYENRTFDRCFDELNPNWKKDAQYNFTFLTNIRQDLQNRLEADGYLFLNDVYDALGFPKTQAGFEYGWLWNRENKPTVFVDFGIFNIDDEKTRSFLNGQERSIWLTFNCDKFVWSKTNFQEV